MGNETTIKILERLIENQKTIIHSSKENIKETNIEIKRLESNIKDYNSLINGGAEAIVILANSIKEYKNKLNLV